MPQNQWEVETWEAHPHMTSVLSGLCMHGLADAE